jgi:hypothetical protein
MTTETPRCIEIATFRARSGTARPRLADALARSQTWLEARPGFVSRRLAHDAAEDTWVDTVEWRSAEDARRAMEAYASAPFAEELNGLIDPTTFRCLRAAPVPLPAAA